MNRRLFQVKQARIVSQYLPKDSSNLGLEIYYQDTTHTCWISQFLSWRVMQFKQQGIISINPVSSTIKFSLVRMNSEQNLQTLASYKLSFQNLNLYKEREKKLLLKTPNDFIFGELFIQFYQLSIDFRGFYQYHIFIEDIDVFLFERLQKMYTLEIRIDKKRSNFAQTFKMVNRKGRLKIDESWHLRDIKLSSSITFIIKQKDYKLLKGKAEFLVDDIERGKFTHITINLVNKKRIKMGHININFRMNNLFMQNDNHVKNMICQIHRKDVAQFIENEKNRNSSRPQNPLSENNYNSKNPLRRQSQNSEQKLILKRLGQKNGTISEAIQNRYQKRSSVLNVSLSKLQQSLQNQAQSSGRDSLMSIDSKIKKLNRQSFNESNDDTSSTKSGIRPRNLSKWKRSYQKVADFQKTIEQQKYTASELQQNKTNFMNQKMQSKDQIAAIQIDENYHGSYFQEGSDTMCRIKKDFDSLHEQIFKRPLIDIDLIELEKQLDQGQLLPSQIYKRQNLNMYFRVKDPVQVQTDSSRKLNILKINQCIVGLEKLKQDNKDNSLFQSYVNQPVTLNKDFQDSKDSAFQSIGQLNDDENNRLKKTNKKLQYKSKFRPDKTRNNQMSAQIKRVKSLLFSKA